MSAKADSAAGAISVAVFGVSAILTPADATAWGNVIINIAPAILILFLIWRMHRLDKQHTECSKNWTQTREQLALAYRALLDAKVCNTLPSEVDFMSGNFKLDNHKIKETAHE